MSALVRSSFVCVRFDTDRFLSLTLSLSRRSVSGQTVDVISDSCQPPTDSNSAHMALYSSMSISEIASLGSPDDSILYQQYDPADYQTATKTMRTRRPTNEKQPSPVPRLFNHTTRHLIPPTRNEVTYLPYFLTEDECDHFIQLGHSHGFEASPVLLSDGTVDTTIKKRTSLTTFLKHGQDEVVRRIERRAAALFNVTVDYIKPLQVVKYLPGQRFESHFDGNDAYPLRSTIFIYLNTVPRGHGGETDFASAGIRFQPERCHGVKWHNMCPARNQIPEALHAGLAITEGVKYGLNVWVGFDPQDMTKNQYKAGGY